MKLVFLSYNIQLPDLDVPGHEWAERKTALLELLRQSDVMALQEVSHLQFLEISALAEYEFLGYNTVTGLDLRIPAPENQEGLVVGWRKTRGQLLQEQGLRWYSSTPLMPSNGGCAFPKCLLQVRLVWDGEPLEVLNSHFAHDPNFSDGSNPRQRSAEQEIAILRTLPHRWISAGDRNFHRNRDEGVYQYYLDQGYLDTKTKENTSGSSTTFLGYEGHPRCNPYTASGEFEQSYYLDIVFHSAQLSSSQWISHLGEYDLCGRLLPLGPPQDLTRRAFASDHTAIFVHFLPSSSS